MDLLRELVKNNLVFEGVEVEQLDSVEWVLSLPLGEVEGGVYKGGYWGDAVVTGFPATLNLLVGDLYDEGEFVIGEGKVNVAYEPASGLAYTGELENLLCDRITELYGLSASGSEQGMQGDDYLSLDVWQPDAKKDVYYG